MARLSPEEGFNVLKERMSKAVSDIFPIIGKRQTLTLSGITVDDKLDIDDIQSQKKARLAGRTWSVPVDAHLNLIDNATSKVIDKQSVRIFNLPKITRRYSNIIDGQEYQMDNQWRLKSGAYSLVKDDGSLETEFNLANSKGRGFKVQFDPNTRKFDMSIGDSHIPLAPLVRSLGISHEELEQKWGKEITNSNAPDDGAALFKFYTKTTGLKTKDIEVAKQHIWTHFDGATMHPEVNQITLGKPYDKVNGHVLLDAAHKLLGISRGTSKPDPRDALQFKSLYGAEDLMADRLAKNTWKITDKFKRNTLDHKDKISDIVGTDSFSRPIKDLFKKNSLAQVPSQTNPLEMISGHMRTTITGDGGIKNANAITEDAKLVDPSHLGFLDPVHTPEGETTGTTLRLPLGVHKNGLEIQVKMYNMKTGKQEYVNPTQAMNATVVLPDQVRWNKNGKPTPLHSKVKISGINNEIESGSFHKADYVMQDPMQMFSVSSNLIPFMNSDHPNRSTMAGRHMEQAISIKDRQAPLVQSLAGKSTFDDLVGRFASHRSAHTGTVTKVSSTGITIKDEAGKKREVQLYDNFPLNADKGFMHSESLVKVGDKITRGQTIADTNFTKNGTLALGTNMRVGYMPYRGYNYEDGVVISEGASKRLTSEHLHRNTLERDPTYVFDKKKFHAYVPDGVTKESYSNLDDEGVIKAGTIVKPGQVLIAALRQRLDTERVEDANLSKLHKSIVRPFRDASIKWDGERTGVVEEVVKNGKSIAVHVKTESPAEIGDKIAGRHGNKGIITKIIPDHDMPQTTDGKKLEILLNPTGVPGRTNLGQILETAAGKIAEKTGKTYMIKNFDPGVDMHAKVTKELARHGIDDKEDIIDPSNGRTIGRALVGPQYILKLEHQVSKKLKARAGGPGYAYDRDLTPKGGDTHGAQALGTLGLYSMLAHGAKENIREMQTVKSDAGQGDEFWAALQAGEMLPAPRATFAYTKFMSYIKALGVNTKKEGHNITLVPMTDHQVKDMSNGEIKDAGKWVRGKDMRPEAGGLFDPKITGGLEGTKWSHIKLPEPYPNPMFAGAIQSLTNLKAKEFDSLLAGDTSYDRHTKKITPYQDGGLVGGKAFHEMLGHIDTKSALAEAKTALNNQGLKGNRLDNANRKVRLLQALDTHKLTAQEAYMSQHIPVLPPSMRPLAVLPNGTLAEDDLNGMYKYIHLSAQKQQELSHMIPEDDESKKEIRKEVYDGLSALAGIGAHPKNVRRGIIDIISGKRYDKDTKSMIGQPKTGFFQDKLVQRKQDLSMRSTIIPEPAMGIDEVGIPKAAALELYKPFVVRELRSMTGVSPLQAKKMIQEGDPSVHGALERVMSTRPILLKRDPALHKYSVQAFKPRLVGGRAVQIHPLVTSGFNADFDGDTMSAFVPVSDKAIDEARKMFPSNNLFHPATGQVMYTPTLESQLGLYGSTQHGKVTKKKFKNIEEVRSSQRKGELLLGDRINVGGIEASTGRFLIAGALPEAMRKDLLTSKKPLDGKLQKALLETLAKNHPHEYGVSVNKLKDFGNLWATESAFSVGMEDIAPMKTARNAVMAAADKKVALLKPGVGRDAQAIKIYEHATDELHAHIEKLTEKDSRLMTMHRAGIKPGMDTLRQIKMAPMLIANAKGEIIPDPVRQSYAEGLDVSGYWTSMSGARKGILQKVQSVKEPGYLTKQIMNSTMNNLIVDDDCGSHSGISLSIDEKDILDRFTATHIKAGSKHWAAGTLITPEIRDRLRNNNIKKVVVRSPLRCEHGPGICKKCYGLTEEGKLPEVGLNVGVISAQGLGERAVQLSMKAFHTGGSAASKTDIVDEFSHVNNLLKFPKKLPGSATLAQLNGTVSRMEKDPAGGHNIYIGEHRHYVPQSLGIPTYNGALIKPGTDIRKGAPISRGPVNPHEMLPLTGVEPVQGYLAGELHGIYGPHGIRRRNTEVVVKALTNLTKIEDVGDNDSFIRGDFAPQTYVANLNRNMPKGSKPILHSPILKGVNMLPLDMQEDWMARLNHDRLENTLVDAAQQGWTSRTRGAHPIPAVVHGVDFGKGKPGEY